MMFSRMFPFRTLSKDPNTATSMIFCLLLPAVIVPMMAVAPTPKAHAFLFLSLAVAMALPIIFPVIQFNRVGCLQEWRRECDHETDVQPWHDVWSQLHRVAEAYFFTWCCLFVVLMFLEKAPTFVIHAVFPQLEVAFVILWIIAPWIFVLEKFFRRNAWTRAVNIWTCAAFVAAVFLGFINLTLCRIHPDLSLELMVNSRWLIILALVCFISMFLIIPARWYLDRRASWVEDRLSL